MAKRGAIIVLDGMVGCGKTTQMESVKKDLWHKSIDFLYGREPGGVPSAEKIRGVILDPANKEMHPLAVTFMFEAARAEYFAKLVIPTVESGRTVLTDRSYFSTIAFQGYGSGVSVAQIERYNHDAVFGYRPDISFLLDVENVRSAVARAQMASGKLGEPDRFEQEELDFHTRLRDGYRAIPGMYPEMNIHLVPHCEEEAGAEKQIARKSEYILSKLTPFLDEYFRK